MNKGEFLGELRQKDTTMTIKELTQQGIALEQNFQGTFEGKYSARTRESVKTLLAQNGSFTSESLGLHVTPDGDVILVRGKGKGIPTSIGTGKYKFEAEVTLQTGSKKLEWLNTSKALADGTADLSSGEFLARWYAAT